MIIPFKCIYLTLPAISTSRDTRKNNAVCVNIAQLRSHNYGWWRARVCM